LAGEAKLIERCVLLRVANLEGPKYDASSAWVKYRQVTDELTAEIERYVAKYANTRGKDQTVRAFTYRVWAVSLMAGEDKGKEASQLICSPVLDLPR
jgi:hypothetical protein